MEALQDRQEVGFQGVSMGDRALLAEIQVRAGLCGKNKRTK